MAYWRRRGWLAWHVAALVRTTDDFPELHALTGEDPPGGAVPSDEKTLHAVRMWKAVLANPETVQ